jgi:hypothetical protein
MSNHVIIRANSFFIRELTLLQSAFIPVCTETSLEKNILY